jgi:type VI secretion system protein ImpH
MADDDRTAPPAVAVGGEGRPGHAGTAPPAAVGADARPAGHGGIEPPAVYDRAETLMRALEQTPFDFDFFQALRRLECLYRDRPRWGSALRPSEEPIRLGQEVSLMAAPATLARFRPPGEAVPARLYAYFFGMLGPDGPLPLHLTDYARQRLHHSGDATLVRFLDMFHHRLMSLFYRAWASGQPTVQRDRPENDRFLLYLGALCGFGLPTLRQRDAFPDHAKLYYAGLLAPQARNAAGLRAMIADFLQMPARIEEFVGEWVTIPRAQGWHLGVRSRRGGPLLGRLGQSALVGTRVWMRQHRFRVVLGPLRREQFRSMLPGANGLPRLTALVSNYLGDELKWDVRLMLTRDAIRPLELGVNAQLGRTTWIVAKVGHGDWEDLVLDPAQDYARAVGATRSRPSVGPAMQGVEHV